MRLVGLPTVDVECPARDPAEAAGRMTDQMLRALVGAILREHETRHRDAFASCMHPLCREARRILEANSPRPEAKAHGRLTRR